MRLLPAKSWYPNHGTRAGFGGRPGSAEDVVGLLVAEQFHEGVLDEAAGEDLGRVIGGDLFAVPAGEAVDEGVAGVAAEFPAALVVEVVDAF